MDPGSVGISLDFGGLCLKVVAVVGRLEAEQRSGSTGDGFLLCMCTSWRHMLCIFAFQISHLETQCAGILQEAWAPPCILKRFPT